MDPASQRSNVEIEYKNPPIRVRSLEVTTKISPNEFERLAPSWLQAVVASGSYPKQQLLQHWDFFVRPDKKGVPVPKGVLRSVPQLSAQSATGKLSRSIDLYPPNETETAKIMFTLYRPSKTVTRYTELRGEAGHWLPPFLEIFGVNGFGGVRLRYDNDLSSQQYPAFWGTKGLELSRVLNFFANNPAPTGEFRPPFRTELNLLVDKSVPSYMRTAIVSDIPDKTTLRVTFEYASKHPRFDRTVADCIADADRGHALILEHFEKHFTKEALTAFRQ
jgi:hypothetical protein